MAISLKHRTVIITYIHEAVLYFICLNISVTIFIFIFHMPLHDTKTAGSLPGATLTLYSMGLPPAFRQ